MFAMASLVPPLRFLAVASKAPTCQHHALYHGISATRARKSHTAGCSHRPKQIFGHIKLCKPAKNHSVSAATHIFYQDQSLLNEAAEKSYPIQATRAQSPLQYSLQNKYSSLSVTYMQATTATN